MPEENLGLIDHVCSGREPLAKIAISSELSGDFATLSTAGLPPRVAVNA